jgi:hypothetical protein
MEREYYILSQEDDHIRVVELYYEGIYDIMLSPNGDFDHAVRWKGRIGSNPQYYTSIEEVPRIHQGILEDVILKHKSKLAAAK